MTTYFTSDHHFSHRSILAYTDRPFRSVDEMDAALVDAWNTVVKPSDTVWHLGDFCLGKTGRGIEIARSLCGRKHIVWGNHDKSLRKDKTFCALFESQHDLTTVKVPDADHPHGVQRIVVCHYALKIWDRAHYGAWHLFGHSHGSLAEDPHSLSLDVGVDAWTETWKWPNHETREIVTETGKRYRPVPYEAIKARMAMKTWRPVDGHRGDRE